MVFALNDSISMAQDRNDAGEAETARAVKFVRDNVGAFARLLTLASRDSAVGLVKTLRSRAGRPQERPFANHEAVGVDSIWRAEDRGDDLEHEAPRAIEFVKAHERDFARIVAAATQDTAVAITRDMRHRFWNHQS